MLQFIRSKAGSFVVKILFVFLIASFGIWGIGDFLRQTPADNTVISVGDEHIPGNQIQTDVQREIDRLRPMFGGNFDLAQAKSLGIVDQAVKSEVGNALLDQEAQHLGLPIGDSQILAALEDQAAFRGPNGQFDRITFENVLASNNLTEAQYEAMVRSELPRGMVAGPVSSGAVAPRSLADQLYRIRNERRVADWVYLPDDAVKDVSPPDDAALHAYYDKHHDRFTAPEYRGFTVLALQPADVAGQVKLSDRQLEDTYQQRLDEFTTPEQRHVLQMLLPDQAAADRAVQAVAAGRDFTEIAKTVAGQDPSTIDLGWSAKADLPGDVAARAFAAKDGEVTKPVKSPFGWSILKIAGVKAGGVKSFDDAKPQVEADLRKSEESDLLYKLSNKVQDALSAGADLGQIAQQFALKPFIVAASDSQGMTPDGKPVEGFPLAKDTLLKTAFDTAEGQVSELGEIGDGEAFYAVKVDKVTSPRLKPLAEVKDEVRQAWLSGQRAARTAEQAKALAQMVKPGTALTEAAAFQRLQVATTNPFTRSTPQSELPLPPALVTRLFSLQPGEAGFEPGPAPGQSSAAVPSGQYVAQLKLITPADPAADPKGVEAVADQLDKGLASELLAEFEAALRERFPVEIRKAALDQLFPASPE